MADGRIYGLIGETLKHSYSTPIHHAFGTHQYALYEIKRDGLERFLLKNDIGGLNVTIPYKQEVIPYLDSLTKEAQSIGAVNTIVPSGKGLCGHNTDFGGFCHMLKKAGIDPSGKKAVIFGSGGTSRTARAALQSLGASNVVIISRSGENNYDNIFRHYDAEIIVNATPVGMYPDNLAAPADITPFRDCVGVVDVIYNPRRTALLLQAETLGIPHIGGLSMLVEQARLSEEMFFGKPVKKELGEEICSRMGHDFENIILIGMPGSGKTSIGRILSEKTGRPWVDTDELIEKRTGRTIPEIFEESGEAAFRELEREAAYAAGKLSGHIITTGGGIVLGDDNYAPLHQNGRIYQLQREISRLDRRGRPLSSGLERLRAMARERAPRYEMFRDRLIDNNGSKNDAADAILSDFMQS